jgi:hypothetical protein
MTEQEQPPSDTTGWSQPPAPQPSGSGPFVDRPPVGPGAPLPPGAGSPIQPGPPMSVQTPIRDTGINLAALAVWVGVAILAIVLVGLVLNALSNR